MAHAARTHDGRSTPSQPQMDDFRSSRGFTLAELVVAMGVTLAVTAVAFSTLRSANQSVEIVAMMSDVNQNLRIAMNIIIRDLIQAGEGDYSLRTGVSIPSGDGVEPIVRPSPPGSNWFFPARYTALPAVSPDDGAGPIINDITTDVITILYEDRSLDFSGVEPNIPASGASLTFPNGFDMGDESTGIKEGDLIRFGSGPMQEVTLVAGLTVHFRDDAGSNLNQRDAPQGSVMELKSDANTFPPLPVSRVRMITYYLKPATAPDSAPMLVRRVNYGEERVVAVGVENLQFTWDLVDGVTNPTNVQTFDDETLEGQIRKCNLYMAARSQDVYSGSNRYMRSSLSTQVSLRSLAFVSRYDLAQ